MLALTSLLFAANTVDAWARSAYLYSAAFIGLTVSSVAFHTSDKSHLHENPWF
jgi:predicted membrane channel-forming protein YqfA (hemolysin III family)